MANRPSVKSMSHKEIIDKYSGKAEIEFYPSGSVVMDSLLGGGIPKGVFWEIASKEGIGKSTMALHFCRALCAVGKKVVYLDTEQAVNQSQIEGIELTEYLNDSFLFLQPNTFEEAEEIIYNVVDDNTALVVIDSMTALTPQKVMDLPVGEVEPGLHARYESNFLAKYKPFAKKKGVSFLFINQMRVKFGTNFRSPSRVEAAGGFAQKHYMDIRLDLFLSERLKGDKKTMSGVQSVIYGSEVAITATKNKYFIPYVQGIVTIIFGKGISNLDAYRRWMVAKGIIVEKGAGYVSIFFDEDEKGEKIEVKKRGQKEVKDWIKENRSRIVGYIQDNGGFKLLLEGDIDGSS